MFVLLKSCTWKYECQVRYYVQEELFVQYQVKQETLVIAVRKIRLSVRACNHLRNFTISLVI